MTFRTLFAALTLATMLSLAALILYAGNPGEPWWWSLATPFSVWIIGPAAAPWLIARRMSARWAGGVMFACLIAVAASSAHAYHDAFFRSESSTAALIMVFLPLYQWLALGLVVAGCLIAGALSRRD